MFRLNALIVAAALLLTGAWAAQAAGPPFELAVKKGHFIGDSRGTLIFTTDGVEYRTTDKDDARKWAYEDVKQVQVLSPTRITIRTYEEQGWLKLRAERAFEFEVTREAAVRDLVTFLLQRITRPVVTAVMPRVPGEPLFRVAVHHERRDSDGTLNLYSERLVYLTERDDDARFWRFGDIYAVLQLDRYRLQVIAYEGGGGKTRTFTFDLKADLPPGFYDTLWTAVNPPGIRDRLAEAPAASVTPSSAGGCCTGPESCPAPQTLPRR